MTDQLNQHDNQKPPWYAEGDPWVLSRNEWNPEKTIYFESIFSQSNGYMGIRGYHEENNNEPSSCREGYLAGVFGVLPPPGRRMLIHDYPWDSRQMVSLPQLFSARILLKGESFSLVAGVCVAYEESLDMRNSILRRQVTWTSPKGNTTKLWFTRFLSAANPHLAIQKIEIEPVDWTGTVEITWQYDITEPSRFRCGDPAKPHQAFPLCTVIKTAATGTGVSGLVKTKGTGHQIAYASQVDDAHTHSTAQTAGILTQRSKRTVAFGAKTGWIRVHAIITSRDAGIDNPLREASEIAADALHAGYDSLEHAHKHVWTARWNNADIEIDGPSRDQVLVRFGCFSLLQVAPFHTDSHSIPARCYAYNRYNGLYFWDGEIFLIPFYQCCVPGVACNLLRFRCRTLPGARKNAALLDVSGAMFPWQGDADFGEEQAPWGLYKYLWHQNADIVYAFDQYARATGDETFICCEALELLAETARFWAAKSKCDKNGVYHIYGTVGPDEAEEHGPDNGYTNLMAQRNLETSYRWWMFAYENYAGSASAVAAKVHLELDEIKEWKHIARAINIPTVPGCPGVPLQDAVFLQKKPVNIQAMTVEEYWQRRGDVQVIKQADIVLAMYLLDDIFTKDEIARGYEYYEPKTLHVSSLSYNTHCIVAAGIGKDDEAYSYFLRAAGLDLDNLRNATNDGLHAAALGAVWQMVIAGFMGMRIRENHISFKPDLPEAWREVRFPIHYRGWKLTCAVGSDHYHIEVSGAGQQSAVLVIGETEYILAEGLVIAG